ncbi:MAG: magnesium transporter CorA family protein [Planctomycetaceae bacterium]
MTVAVIEFDFATHDDRELTVADVAASLAGGRSVWVDIDLSDPTAADAALQALAVNPRVLETLSASPSVGRHDVYDDCFHVSIAIPQFDQGLLRFEHVDLVIADRLLVTLHRGETNFVAEVRKGYPTFFRKFAQSLGFLLFEIWDLLIERFRHALTRIEEEVEDAQKAIFNGASDEIFQRVAALTSCVLDLRKAALAMRDALDMLGTHKSVFVAPTAQPYLLNMVGSLNRLAGDLTVERETLAEVLTLYLGIVSHRTNQLLHRLTVVSIFFMPLTFLCGVYGMNFDLPEFGWRYGYLFFWSLIVACVTLMATWMRWRRIW